MNITENDMSALHNSICSKALALIILVIVLAPYNKVPPKSGDFGGYFYNCILFNFIFLPYLFSHRLITVIVRS